MHRRAGLLLVAVLGMLVPAHAAVLQGKITNQSGRALTNAIVKLIPLGISDTTMADGMYSITTGVVSIDRSHMPSSRNVTFRDGVLELDLITDAPVMIEIFDTKGGMVKSEMLQSVSRGIYRWDVAQFAKGTQVLLIKVTVGQSAATFRYAAMSGSSVSASAASLTQVSGSLARVAAVADSIVVSASGYKTKTIATPSLDATVNVTLDTAGSSNPRIPGNTPVKSSGCGTTSSALPKSGTYKISTVAGRGEFIIDIPTSYNKDNPYRLIFANHCMGGSAARMAAADNKGLETGDDLSGYYSIKTMATRDNIQNIYVAMQGDGSGTWNLPNDSKFWLDVLKHVETNLCVDTTRVFVAGFSFGAMFSYVLSLEHPERIRAVATYAPANYNMAQPTNRKIPIAYYQAHGTSDGTCRWVNNDGQKTGAKYCLLQHMQDNGCTSTDADIKLATSSTHVVNEFKGCKEGYPVKFSSFQGGHQAEHADPGSKENWVQKETWEFFKRF